MLDKYYNIDKINCIVQKKGELQQIHNTKMVPKVLYKPIFYRTYELQSIKIRIGLRQNIGINLADYMTKVDGFKISIDGKEFIEFSRNDVYVIFKIDSTVFTNTSGTYHVLDQDGEYISSGKWEMIE